MKKTLMAILLTGLSSSAQTGEFVARLTCPSKLLCDEFKTQIKVAVSNGTPSAIRVFERLGSSQVYFALQSQPHMDYCLRERHLRARRSTVWDSLSANDTGTFPTRLLNPGETHEWGFYVLFTPFLQKSFRPDYLNITQMELYAQVLVGPDQWAISNTNTVIFSTQSCENGSVLFSAPCGSWQGAPICYVREVWIDGERFLFCEDARMCKISNTTTPSFAIDALNPDIINVTFDDNTPPFRWDIRKDKLAP